MEDLANAPSLPQHLHSDRVDEEGPVVGNDLYDGGTTGSPTVIGLARRTDADHSPRGGSLHRCPVMALDEPEEVRDAALVDIHCIDVSEVVLEKRLHGVRVLTQLGSYLRRSGGYLSEFLCLLLLQFDLESGHFYRPIIAAPPRCVATSDISPTGSR